MSHFSLENELTTIQREAFNYFLNEVNLANGLIKDKTADNWPASIAAIGFALASYPIAIERGFISRDDAILRTLNTLRFFWQSKQSPDPDATGYKGFYYHFLDMQTGKRAWHCELSVIDSAILIAGMLAAAVYFNKQNKQEEEIRTLADALYRRVEWSWAENEHHEVTMGWTPESGFLKNMWEGYDEVLLLYILGLASPTFPLSQESYVQWTKTFVWKTIYNIDLIYAGPLFIHQFSHIWIDFRGIQDDYTKNKNCDYFENSRRATYIHQLYAKANPLEFTGYNDLCWGYTASDGPGPHDVKIHGIHRQFYDYIARGAPYGPDDGTLAPWSAITSLPFAPEIILPLIEHYIYNLKLKHGHPYGFTATFNPTYKLTRYTYWISPWHFGINQGPIVLMTENYRTNFIWNLMRQCPYIVTGLKRAGFKNGWLATC